MRAIRHPLSGAVYDLREDGTIHVTGRDQRQGIFDRHGRWVAGDLKQADPQLCLWVSDSAVAASTGGAAS